jgi:hypothetical protein
LFLTFILHFIGIQSHTYHSVSSRELRKPNSVHICYMYDNTELILYRGIVHCHVW